MSDFEHLNKITTPKGKQHRKYPRLIYRVSDSQGHQTWVPMNDHYPEGSPDTDAKEIAYRVRSYPRLMNETVSLQQDVVDAERAYCTLEEKFNKVHAALDLAVRLLPDLDGDNADELYESLNGVLFELEMGGHRINTKIHDELKKETDIPF